MRLTVLPLILIAAASLAACGKPADDRPVTVTPGVAMSSPDDAPGFAPPYPGSRVTSRMTWPRRTVLGVIGNFNFRTSDSPEQVFSFYKRQAAAAWLQESRRSNRNWAASGVFGRLVVEAYVNDGETWGQVAWTKPF